MGEKLNTAECDKKGRCIRHPAIRLRKKKIFGGWKIIIGHCPECCLDEMRRVRDEIGAENSNGSDDDNNDSPRRRSRKSKDRDRQRKSDKKKKKRRDRDRSNRDRSSNRHVKNEDSFSHSEDIIGNSSEGHHHHHHHSSSQHMSHNGSSIYSLQDNNNIKPRRLDQHVGHPQHKQQQLNNNIDDQPSVGTGSTAMNSSMDGTVNSNMSPRVGYPHTGHGGPVGTGGYQQYQLNRNPPPQANNNNYHRQHQQQSLDNFPSPPKPPPPQRTMVLSMAFTDPQTGQRGTYTGQVNSINHKPDGKGTVYYANGNIAEGSWSNGILLDESSSGGEEDDDELSGSQHSNNMGNSPNSSQLSRGRNTAPLRGDEEQFVRSASRGGGNGGGEGYYQPETNNNGSRSSRQGSMRGVNNPGPPLRRSESDRYNSTSSRSRGSGNQRRSSGSSFADQRMNRGSIPTNNMPSGNLAKLESLPGNKKRRSKPRGASASVQNVRGQDSFNVSSGSASVQDFRYSGGNASFSGFMDRGGGGLGDGGSLRDFGTGNDNQRDFGGSTHSMGFLPDNRQYNRNNSTGYSSQQQRNSRNPPGYR